jgi:glycosyltransferase involved in cell wall biosynthesis
MLSVLVGLLNMFLTIKNQIPKALNSMTRSISFLIPSMNGGGAEKVTMLLANELSSRGWNVALIMAKREGPYLERLAPNIRVIILKKRNVSRNVFEISTYLRKEKPEIFYSSMMYVNVIAALATKISGFKGKLILSEHSHVSTNLRTGSNKIFKLIFAIAKLIYRYADAIICVSDGVKTDLLSLIKGIKTAYVIHNPIEEATNSHVHELDGRFRIISIGRLDVDKNFKLLIEGFSGVLATLDNKDNYELVILGEGNERHNLERLIDSLDIRKQVLLPGFVKNPGDYLNRSNLFVFTSSREGFGNVIVEALGYGLPVISTDCFSGPSEILKDGEIGRLIPVGDLEMLKKVMLEEIGKPRTDSEVQARKTRAKEFSVAKITDRYEQVFDDLQYGRNEHR